MNSNSKAVKTVASTLAASVMISSCYNGHDFEDCMYGSFSENPTAKGIALLNVNESNLSETFQKKAVSIGEIVSTILSDTKEAKEFASNPDCYLALKEHDLKITLSEEEKRVLQAFSDEDIIKAVKEKDFNKFIKICNEKNYILPQTVELPAEEVRALFKSEKDYEDFVNTLNLGEGEVSTYSGLLVVGVAVVTVLYVIAATILEVGVAVQAVAAVDVEIGGVGESSYSATRSSSASTNVSALKIWTDNNGKISDNTFYSEIIEKQISTMTKGLQETLPEIDLEKIKSILRLQLEGHYGLRK